MTDDEFLERLSPEDRREWELERAGFRVWDAMCAECKRKDNPGEFYDDLMVLAANTMASAFEIFVTWAGVEEPAAFAAAMAREHHARLTRTLARRARDAQKGAKDRQKAAGGQPDS